MIVTLEILLKSENFLLQFYSKTADRKAGIWQAVCSKIQSLNIYAILQYFHSIQSLFFSFNPILQYFYSIQSRKIDSIQS